MNVQFYPLDVKRDWHWVSQNLPVSLMDCTKGIIAVDVSSPDDEKRVGCVVLDSWTYSAVTSHIYMKSPMLIRHGFLEEVAEYVYGTCGKTLMIGLVAGDLPEVLKFDKKIGFREIAVIEDGVDVGIPMHVLSMRYDECKWFRKDKAAA